MFRTAAAVKPRTQPAARPFPIPASVGGLNANDSIADMPVTDALVLDNIFPQPDYIELRRGYESHATGLGAAVESLMEWAGPAGRKLFGAASSSIYEVTSSGAVGAADVSSLSNARWQHIMQATSGGNFLICVNGADDARSYDGTSWATPSITGVASSTFINVWLFKERLFFIESGTLDAWYLGTKAIAGAATNLPLGSVFKQGGSLIAGGTLTRDGGNGIDDYCVFITTTGEVALYQGTDPSSSTTWSLIGTFYLPPPIGKRCLQRAGGDLAVITEGGVVSLNAAFALDRAAQQRAAITSKINRIFTADARLYRPNAGWQVISYPRSNMLVVNVPIAEGAESRQYVMNALTGAWCRFTNLNANCWSLLNENLYFGGNGTVYKADSGYQDNGGGITADLKTAFTDLGARGRVKTIQMLRALFSSNGSPGFLMDVNVDFEDRQPTSTPTAGTPPASLWGSATWGTSTWVSGSQLNSQWIGAAGVGHAFAIRMRIVSNGATCTINDFDVIATVGGVV